MLRAKEKQPHLCKQRGYLFRIVLFDNCSFVDKSHFMTFTKFVLNKLNDDKVLGISENPTESFFCIIIHVIHNANIITMLINFGELPMSL